MSASESWSTTEEDSLAVPLYGTLLMASPAPRYAMQEQSIAPAVAQQLIEDEMALDGVPRLNLASFVNTYMEAEVQDLMQKASRKNFVDFDHNPEAAELQERCVAMLANLFNAPDPGDGSRYAGTSTIGSSEAIMLAGLALKWKWAEWRRAHGQDTSRPNIVMGANVQVVWHKFCRYFDVEGREAPVSESCLVLTAERAAQLIDENTIGVCAILGSTFNGEYEDVKGIHDMLEQVNQENGWSIPLHVDAASGGFIAPFLTPDLLWDFRLPLVKSINVSGHKFGLVYPGIGWALWREPADLPADLLINICHLKSERTYFGINFTRSCAQLVAQYYQFLRLGKAGYRAIMSASMQNAAYLRSRLVETGLFSIHDKGHMPLVAFSLKDKHASYSVFDIQDRLRSRNWIVPAYTCPPGAEALAIMRVVVRQSFSHDMADTLMTDIEAVVEMLKRQTDVAGPTPTARSAFEAKTNAQRLWGMLAGFARNQRRREYTTRGVC